MFECFLILPIKFSHQFIYSTGQLYSEKKETTSFTEPCTVQSLYSAVSLCIGLLPLNLTLSSMAIFVKD